MCPTLLAAFSMTRILTVSTVCGLFLLLPAGVCDEADRIRFFEQKIRPVLAEHCYHCHSVSNKRRGGLLLDSRAGILEGGDSGPAVVPGRPDDGLLLKVLEYDPDQIRMPPKGRLSDRIIQDFRQWIAAGAEWPKSSVPPKGSEKRDLRDGEKHWAFQPVVRPRVPNNGDSAWPQNAVDQFVLQRLTAAGYSPAPKASPQILIRRLHYNVTGLPPTFPEVNRFLSSTDSKAIQDTITQLLDSPRYGEHWAGHWLDGVRYVSDVGYYNFSDLGWRYRDWVIGALNDDMPYSDFVIHQIAGDLLPDPNGQDVYAQGIVATGVLAMGNYDDQESNKEQLYAEVIDDQIDVVSRQFLGLTISCARCHDHKFDPITTADYYSLGGIFMSSRVLKAGNRIGAPRLEIALNSKADAQRYAARQEEIKELRTLIAAAGPDEREDLSSQLANLMTKVLSPPGKAIGVQEGGYSDSRHPQIGDMAIYVRGNPHQPGEQTPRQLPVIFAGTDQIPIGQQTRQSGRMELARWIASPNNPLTARVIVNRLWHYHFGQGLVRSPNNFGLQGQVATHPELLDFLAAELIDSGWSLKHIHRLILGSATWQQSATGSVGLQRNDPENLLLGRHPIRRLSAEQLYDAILLLSGQLKATIGRGGNRLVYRRVGHEFHSAAASLFDAPAVGTIVPARNESTTPTQSLYLLNDSTVDQAAKRVAQAHRNLSPRDFVSTVWQQIYGRPPENAEIRVSVSYLNSVPADRSWTWVQVLLCSNEFLYVK